MRIFALSARESRADENGGIMKKKAPEKNNEMLREYDFSKGVRGKYARRYARGSNVVVLEPDVAKVFPNAEAVNSSLPSLETRYLDRLLSAARRWHDPVHPEIFDDLAVVIERVSWGKGGQEQTSSGGLVIPGDRLHKVRRV